MPTGALSGLRVIDLTQMLAGPYCTQLLADHGADVIKVEPPQGDHTRGLPPFDDADPVREFGGYFQSVNRNKRSIVLDLRTPDGAELLRHLVADADVLVENYRAGVMERLGLSYESLRAINPRLVYGAIRGFGDPRGGASPYVDWPAFDVVAQAMGGLMGITGPDAGSPLKVGPGVGDILPGIFAAFGIMAALWRARASGVGQFVDVSMVDSVLALCERIVHQHSYTGAVPRPEGRGHPLHSPFGMFPAADGWATIACITDTQWQTLCGIMGCPDWGLDPRFATPQARHDHDHLVTAAVSAFTGAHTKQQLLTLLGGRVPFGPVYDMADIAVDPHFAARSMLVDVDHPGLDSPRQIAGIPVKLTATPGHIRRPAPRLGEHQEEIMAELIQPPRRHAQGGTR